MVAGTLQVVVGTYENLTLGYKLEETDTKSTFTLRFTDHEHTGAVRCVALSEGHILATGSTDSSIKLINLRKGAPIGKIGRPQGAVTCIQFFGKWNMFSSSEDGTIVVWDKSWEIQRILRGHTDAVYSFSIHPSGKIALSLGKDKTLRMWNLMTAKCAFVTNMNQSSKQRKYTLADTVLWCPSGEAYIVVIDRIVDVYSRETAQVTHTIQCPFKIACVVFITNDVLAVSGDGGVVEFHNIIRKEKLQDLETNTVRVKGMVVVPSGEPDDASVRLIVATSDGFIKLYRVRVETASVTCKHLAEINTGFRLLSVAAADIDMKPTKVELTAAAEQLESGDEKPVLLSEGGQKRGRAERVIVQEGSSSDPDDSDDVVEVVSKNDRGNVKKKKKTNTSLRINRDSNDGIKNKKNKNAQKQQVEEAEAAGKLQKVQDSKSEQAVVKTKKMKRKEDVASAVNSVKGGQQAADTTMSSVDKPKKVKKSADKKKSEERSERFLHETKSNGKVAKNRPVKKLRTTDMKKLDIDELKKHSKPFKKMQRR